MSKNPKFDEIVNIDEENIHIFRTTSGISMKFSGKMCRTIMLRVTKKQDFTLSLEIQFWKNRRRSNCPLPPSQTFKS